MTDVIVIGAGIVGATCAWRLAQAGARVTILERRAPASEASQAALGVLTFHAKPGMPAEYHALCQRSRDLYPTMIDELADITGERPDYRAGGQLFVALTEADLPEVDAAYALNADRGIEVGHLSPDECRLLEPRVSNHVCAGVFFPEDAWVDNTTLTFTIVRAAEEAGALLMRGDVQAVVSAEGQATGVHCGGETLSADWIVLAAGSWSGQIAGVPRLPVTPVRGQALAVAGRPVRRVVFSPRGYLVPKGESRTLVGATVEYVGFDDSNTLGGVREVSAAGFEISPALGSGEFLGAWAGLRPSTPDNLPIIGPFDQLPNLIAATGHFRNGILLAPITAGMVRAIVTGEEPPADLQPFLPNRAALVRVPTNERAGGQRRAP